MSRALLLFLALLISDRAEAQNPWTRIYPFDYSKTSGITKDGKGRIYASGGLVLYRSSNNGQSWQQLKTQSNALASHGDTLFRIYAGHLEYSLDDAESWITRGEVSGGLNIHPSGAIFANTGASVKRSLDGGNTWVEIKPDYQGKLGADIFEIDKQGNLLASKSTRFYVSSDLGDTWAMSRPPIESGGRFTQVIATQDNHYILLSKDSTSLSTDGGQTWSDQGAALSTDGVRWSALKADSSGGVIGVAEGKLYQRKGNVVAPLGEGTPITVLSDGSLWLKRPEGRLGHLSPDFAQFTDVTKEISDANARHLVRLSNGEYYLTFDVMRHLATKDFMSFEQISLPDSIGSFIDLQSAPSGDLYSYAAIDGHMNILRSTDFGRRWNSIKWELYDKGILFGGIDSNGWIYTGYERSKDNGVTWDSLWLPGTYAGSLAFGSGSRIAGVKTEGVFISTDNGESWSTRTYHQSYSYTDDIFFADKRLVLLQYDTIYFTNDLGLTWDHAVPPKSKPYYSIVHLALDEHNRIFGSGEGRVFLFDPTSMQFTNVAYAPDSLPIDQIYVRDGRIIIETSQGLFYMPAPARNAVKDHDVRQQAIRYENGAIVFSEPIDPRSTIQVYDVTGRSVATYVATDRTQFINVGRLTAGAYFVQVTAPGGSVYAKFSIVY